IGIAFQKPFDSSRLLLAAFVEGGMAKYHVYANYGPGHNPATKADGEFKSIDFGLIFRQKWDNGIRLEAAARYGWLYSKFRSDDLLVRNDKDEELPVRFNYETPFFAAHLGIGYEHQINEVSTLDFVGRYYYTTQRGKTISIEGHKVTFDGLESHRVRAGLRYTRAHNPRMSYYVGAYAEHDFSHRATGSVQGLKFRSDKYGGFTGIGEIGVIFHSTDDRPWNVEAGFQVYGGNVRGFSGGFRFGYQF
ncbi:MAG: autotransporter outer membrane beta-barrel domain-containing protein, partial [Deltaproteobacteria bacterium]|nr:autotransporter outer membrane beta-barrel domain-containing protein [Deltaproteobacteria bacterium]